MIVTLTIRNAQLALFETGQKDTYIRGLCDSLRTLFLDELREIQVFELYELVKTTLLKAQNYGLKSERDVFRYTCLSVACGWHFGAEQANVWMVNMLTDAKVSNPGDRLDRVIAEYFHRCDMAERARLLTEDFQGRVNSSRQ